MNDDDKVNRSSNSWLYCTLKSQKSGDRGERLGEGDAGRRGLNSR